MCGIAGRVALDAPVDRPAFERMTDALAHRGPDGRGTWYARGDRVALGHRRLAILDLSDAGAQPMTLPGSGLRLTYNGEIYNHPELRAELEAKGHVYRSRTDSESILHAYVEWGTACVKRLNGIFAFALWDEAEGRLLCARDPLGVKPLYLARSGDALAFASQPGALLALPEVSGAPDPEGALDYLAYGVVPGTRSAFAGVSKLPPAHALEWREGRTRTWTYWRLPERADLDDAREAAAALDAALERVVVSQLASDVPVASFLSGGIDSSLLSAIAARHAAEPVTAYTIGFENARFDERPYAAAAAEAIGARPVVATMTHDDLDRTIEDVVTAYDEPFGVNAGLAMARIARLAAEHGTKVVLGGDGADELFAGYRHYDAMSAYYRRHGRVAGGAGAHPLRAMLGRIAHGRFDPVGQYRAHNGPLGPAEIDALAGPALREAAGGRIPARRHRETAHFDPSLGPVEASRRADLATYLPDEILVKVDRATMAFGIEARVPFLDPALVTLAFRVEAGLHYAGGERKALLKRAARRWLPERVLSARKRGFTPPVMDWLRAPATRRAMVERLREGRLAGAGFLAPDRLEPTLATLGRPTSGLLALYLLERWVERWASPGTAPAEPSPVALSRAAPSLAAASKR